MIAKSHRRQRAAVVVAALFGLWGPDATALSLGRVTVQSALGEPLRAEVEVLDINAEEANSLKVSAALPETFKAAGLEYNPALSNLNASLQRRADGRAYIQLNSNRVVSEPFVDLILETSWASGRIVRDYTLLFDPPNLRSAAPVAPILPPVLAQSGTRPTNSVAPVPASIAKQAVEPFKPAAKALPRPVLPKAPNLTSAPVNVTGTQVIVKPGDTASRIAASTKQGNVSLDQMLVALLRNNPAAFMGNNVNRIKAGSTMTIPTAEQVSATSATEATQLIIAQSRDFNDFRRSLAHNAPDVPLAAADRQASGTVQARVDDKKAAVTAPDKLTLSKGAAQLSAEDQLAKERNAKDVANRAAEISKNISDLGKLGTASSAVADPLPTASAAVAPSSPVPDSRNATASAPAAVTSSGVKLPTAAPVAKPEASLLDSLFENPLLPTGAVGLIALLVFLGVYRARQRENTPLLDSVMLENRLRPDTYFAVSGGQNVDTHNGTAAGSSLVFAPSQPVGVDDVDPVAEAEVYLAYGRDLQAEEILKDALRANPERIAIHHKMLALFAKRRDAKSFENIARKAFKLTNGEGMDWQRIRELGLSFDASNPVYQPGWLSADSVGMPSTSPAPLDSSTQPADSLDTSTHPTIPPQIAAAVDLDLDLDFSLDEDPANAIRETRASVAETAPGTLHKLPENPKPEAPPAPNLGMLEFDLGSLSLDLEDSVASTPGTAADARHDPLATKLELAQEFIAIGDTNGARTLIEEVIAEASGDMKLKAQRALSILQST